MPRHLAATRLYKSSCGSSADSIHHLRARASLRRLLHRTKGNCSTTHADLVRHCCGQGRVGKHRSSFHPLTVFVE